MHTPKRYERLTHPMVRDRRGEPLRRASWDEALERAAAGFRGAVDRAAKRLGTASAQHLASLADRHGGSTFGLFSCSKATNELNYASQKLARVALGSNNIDSCNRT